MQKIHSKTLYRLVSLIIVAVMLISKDLLPDESIAAAVALFTYTIKAPNDITSQELARVIESVETNKNA